MCTLYYNYYYHEIRCLFSVCAKSGLLVFRFAINSAPRAVPGARPVPSRLVPFRRRRHSVHTMLMYTDDGILYKFYVYNTVSGARRRFMITALGEIQLVIHGRTDANEILTPPRPYCRCATVHTYSGSIQGDFYKCAYFSL